MKAQDSIFGLCMRSGHLVSGGELTLKAVRNGSAKLVVLATDASAQTKKKFHDKCTYYGVDLVEFRSMAELGRALGKEKRSVLAVTEEGFAKTILDRANALQM